MLTKQGVELDYCPQCKGVWMDRGEIYHFVKNPGKVEAKLQAALKRQQPTQRICPRSGKPMVVIEYPAGPTLDYSPSNGGLWFDAGEFKLLQETERQFDASPDRKVWMHEQEQASRQLKIRSGLLPLPNLFLRSTLTLTGLYALLGAVLIAAVEFAGVRPDLAVGIGLAVIFLQFLVGPWFMDLTLRWLYRIDWGVAGMPPHLHEFMQKACKEKKMKLPRFGVLRDGAPQAFTYGHSPNNARIVISQGLLEILEPDEIEAVVAHEIGHVVHWDMLLMTLVQAVPLILYYIYRTLIRVRSSGNDKSAGPRIAVAVTAYILYLISQYIVLWFSRTREYHADRFAGQVTGSPSSLASALVKIAYGLAGAQKEGREGKDKRDSGIEALGALGIFEKGKAKALAVSSFSSNVAPGQVDKKNLKGAMRWDLWNPWAKWHEIHSTHPLVAHRLRYLSDQSASLGQEPYVVFDEVQPESYWDEFAVDLCFHMAPFLLPLVYLAVTAWTTGGFTDCAPKSVIAGVLFSLGAGMLIRMGFAYNSEAFPEMCVAALLKHVKVSAVRPVPCTLKGRVIGRGVPGYILSDDFVMRDDTGIIFLDMRQPLRIWEILFGLLKAGEYQGQEVTVKGWYRRAPVPYIELKSIESNGKVRKSYALPFYRAMALLLVIVGIGLSVMR